MPRPRTNPQPPAQSRRFALTLWIGENLSFLQACAILRNLTDAGTLEYAIAGDEVAPTTGRPHVQAYVRFAGPKMATAAARRLFQAIPGLGDCHVASCWSDDAKNIKYCKKSGVWSEYGDVRASSLPPTMDPEAAPETAYDRTVRLARENRVSEISADHLLRHRHSIEALRHDFAPAPYKWPHQCGLWVYGPVGTGKTTAVMDAFTTSDGELDESLAYLYNPTLDWWQHYRGQKFVIIDEMSFERAQSGWMKAFLKVFSGPYRAKGQIKGGMIDLNPVLIVTANWSLRQVYGANPTDYNAMAKRFRRVHFATHRLFTSNDIWVLANTLLPDHTHEGIIDHPSKIRPDPDEDLLFEGSVRADSPTPSEDSSIWSTAALTAYIDLGLVASIPRYHNTPADQHPTTTFDPEPSITYVGPALIDSSNRAGSGLSNTTGEVQSFTGDAYVMGPREVRYEEPKGKPMDTQYWLDQEAGTRQGFPIVLLDEDSRDPSQDPVERWEESNWDPNERVIKRMAKHTRDDQAGRQRAQPSVEQDYEYSVSQEYLDWLEENVGPDGEKMTEEEKEIHSQHKLYSKVWNPKVDEL